MKLVDLSNMAILYYNPEKSEMYFGCPYDEYPPGAQCWYMDKKDIDELIRVLEEIKDEFED